MVTPGLRLHDALEQSMPLMAQCVSTSAVAYAKVGSNVLAMPFDVAREQYSKAVRLGLIERSLLGSAKFGQMLHALEQLSLGPLARRC